MAASKQFVSVNFTQGQLLDTDTLNQLNNNEVFLRDQMVDGKYTNDWGGVYDVNVKLLCGRVYVPQQNVPVVYGTVAFPSMFSPGFQTIITTALHSPEECKFEHVIYGIGQYWPDHRGFQFKMKINPAYNNQVFSNAVYLNWMAMGA